MVQPCSRTLGLLLLVGCTAAPDSAPPDDSRVPDSGTRPEACDLYTTTGSFGVELTTTYAAFSGDLMSGPSPFTSDELAVDGDCTLFGWERPPVCDPPCEGEEICGFGDECRAWPWNLDAGTVWLKGTSPELEVEPSEWGSYDYTGAWSSPYDPGDVLTLQVEGSEHVEAFELSLAGSPALELDRFELTMHAGRPLEIPWEIPEGPSGMRMRVRLSVDHHATTPAYARCDAPATQGSVTVPTAIVDALIEAGATGIGTYVETATLTLASEAWAETSAGCVVFETASPMYFDVETEL